MAVTKNLVQVDCADCGKVCEDLIHWAGTSARCTDCHNLRMTGDSESTEIPDKIAELIAKIKSLPLGIVSEVYDEFVNEGVQDVKPLDINTRLLFELATNYEELRKAATKLDNKLRHEFKIYEGIYATEIKDEMLELREVLKK